MKRRDKFAYEMLLSVLKQSKDTTKVGCVILGPDDEVRSVGYNGFPRGVEDDPEKVPERYERPEKYEWFEHSERNAFYNAARAGIALKDCILYVSGPPCTDCARGIIQVGIKEVVMVDLFGPEAAKRWEEKIKKALTMFGEAGIKYREYKPEEKE